MFICGYWGWLFEIEDNDDEEEDDDDDDDEEEDEDEEEDDEEDDDDEKLLFLLILLLLLTLNDDEELEPEEELELLLEDLSIPEKGIDISIAYTVGSFLDDFFADEEDDEGGLVAVFLEDEEVDELDLLLRYGFFGVFELEEDREFVKLRLLLCR